jgi:hypothetical protein
MLYKGLIYRYEHKQFINISPSFTCMNRTKHNKGWHSKRDVSLYACVLELFLTDRHHRRRLPKAGVSQDVELGDTETKDSVILHSGKEYCCIVLRDSKNRQG